MYLARKLPLLIAAIFFAGCDSVSDSGNQSTLNSDISDQLESNQNSPSQPIPPSSPTPDAPVNNGPSDTQLLAINGAAVKGPIINAIVSVYRLDNTKTDLKGELLAEGITDIDASLHLLIDQQYLNGDVFLLEFTEGLELNGSIPTIPTLKTLIDSRQILTGEPIYATPLTTFAIEYANITADQRRISSSSQKTHQAHTGNVDGAISEREFKAAIRSASLYAKGAFGGGLLDPTMDLFSHPPILSDTANQNQSLAYRTAIETFAAVVKAITENVNQHGAELTGNDIVSALARDMTDGSINGKENTTIVAELSQLDESTLRSIVSLEPSRLMVPGTNTPINEIDVLIVEEARKISPNVRPLLNDIESPRPINPEFGLGTPAAPQEPAIPAQPEPEQPGTTRTPGVYYSLTNDFDDAVLLQGQELPRTTVYFFFTQDNLDETIFYCCKGISGESNGEPHTPPIELNNNPAVVSINLAQYTAGGTREIYIDWLATDGSFHTDNFWRFSLGNIPTPQPAPKSTPTPQAEPESQPPETSNQPEPEPQQPETNNQGSQEPEQPETTTTPPEADPLPESEQFSKTVTLTWSVPVQRENGDPLSIAEISGYKIYYFMEGTAVEVGEVEDISPIDEQGNLVTNTDITIEQAGFWNFSIAAYDDNNLFSEMSDPIGAVID